MPKTTQLLNIKTPAEAWEKLNDIAYDVFHQQYSAKQEGILLLDKRSLYLLEDYLYQNDVKGGFVGSHLLKLSKGANEESSIRTLTIQYGTFELHIDEWAKPGSRMDIYF